MIDIDYNFILLFFCKYNSRKSLLGKRLYESVKSADPRAVLLERLVGVLIVRLLQN